jgi:hypothetical protein
MHGLVVVVFILGARQREASEVQARPMGPEQQISMVYVPPPPIQNGQRRVDQPISRPAPDAIQAQDDAAAKVRERTPDLPPAVEPSVPEPVEEETPEETMATTPPPPPEAPPEQPTMESEAQRLFGRPKLQTQPTADNQLGVRLGALADQNSAAHRSCVPKQRAPGAQIEMTEVVGRVFYDEAQTRPIPGAFLQMLGTSYSAYSDGTGRYRLVFDASLVDECRTQYVRVVAAGYRGQNLVLGLGVGSNDIILGR